MQNNSKRNNNSKFLAQSKDKALETNRDKKFIPSVRVSSVRDVRVMIAVTRAISVMTCIDNHYYSFGGYLRKQTDVGSIGLDLTREGSCNVMTDWDITFLYTLKN